MLRQRDACRRGLLPEPGTEARWSVRASCRDGTGPCLSPTWEREEGTVPSCWLLGGSPQPINCHTPSYALIERVHWASSWRSHTKLRSSTESHNSCYREDSETAGRGCPLQKETLPCRRNLDSTRGGARPRTAVRTAPDGADPPPGEQRQLSAGHPAFLTPDPPRTPGGRAAHSASAGHTGGS